MAKRSPKPPADPTEGFGAPAGDKAHGAHVFRVEIPRSNRERVLVIEDYGYAGGHKGVPEAEPRVRLERSVWTGVRDAARRDFNPRLKAVGLSTGSWTVGTTRVDRILGRELCVLLWAAEHAEDADQLPALCTRWSALRPEERWWLFGKAAAEAGLPEDRDRGWRKAIGAALADPGEPAARARPRPPEDGAGDAGLRLFREAS